MEPTFFPAVGTVRVRTYVTLAGGGGAYVTLGAERRVMASEASKIRGVIETISIIIKQGKFLIKRER